MNTQEVELRATIPMSHKQTLLKQLADYKPDVKKVVKLVDVYYAPITAESMEDIPMNEVGSFSLRIRATMRDDKTITATLNIKRVTSFGDHNAWDESESSIGDPAQVSKILRGLGYYPFCRLVKTRTSYGITELCTVELDEIERYGLVVEVEHIVPAHMAEEAKNKNQEIFRTLGIREEHMVPRTATEEYMKRFAFKEILDEDNLFNLTD